MRERQAIRLPVRPNRHELVRNVNAQARGGRKVVEDAQRIHELLADPALVWEAVDARVFDGEVAGNGLDDGLARMVILGPRVDLQPRFLFELVSQNWDTCLVRRVPAADEKPLHWVGSSKRDFLSFPAAVKEDMGNALGIAQFGGTSPTAKPWKGLGPGVLEIVESHEGDAYRAVYTVRYEKALYVLHAFQKKSPSGIRTAKRDVDLVAERLKTAERDHEEHYGKQKR